jgi:hypothetical protein
MFWINWRYRTICLLSSGLTGALSPGVKRSRREADHSPPSSAEVKNAWKLYIHSPIRLHGVVLSYEKHRDNFTFNLPHKMDDVLRHGM